ncbi:MAG: hypothetical protein E7587_03365 [Ruminococcaceae bacterium]|nr:hypothetical protein [Oscillospiraceae bacterium]
MYDNLKNVTESVRPVIVESHDFTADLFKNKKSGEPLLHVSSKGKFEIDIFKVLAWITLALVTLSAFSFSVRHRKDKKRKMKKMKAELKAARKAARKTAKNNG